MEHKDVFVYNSSEGEMREIKLQAVEKCQQLDAISMRDKAAREQAIRELFGGA